MKRYSKYFERFQEWYEKNFKKVVLLFLIAVIFTLLLVYMPFINLVFTSSLGFLIAVIIWYLLFAPRTRVLVFLAIGIVFLAMILTLTDLAIFSESLGIFLYLLLVFIFFNFLKELR